MKMKKKKKKMERCPEFFDKQIMHNPDYFYAVVFFTKELKSLKTLTNSVYTHKRRSQTRDTKQRPWILY
jgi:hypothetical protein